MNSINIIIEEDSLSQYELGNIVSVIYLDFGNYQFPEIEWNDLVVAIISSWLDQIQELRSQKKTRIELGFLDGDFLVKVEMVAEGVCRIDCVDESTDSNVEYSTKVSLKSLVSEIVDAASKILMICREKGFSNPDVGKLENAYKRIQN